MTALLLLMPGTPMLFQGQEFAASAPFLYFADHDAGARRRGAHGPRRVPRAVSEHCADPEAGARSPIPASSDTFERCKLDLAEREPHAAAYALHRDLLRLRRDDAVFSRAAARRRRRRGAAASAFVLRFFTRDHREDRLLVVNLGPQIERGLVRRAAARAAGADATGVCAGRATSPRTAAAARRRCSRMSGWCIPAEAPLVLAPGPQRGVGVRRRRPA